MTKKIKRQRFSKNEWLEAGLNMLATQGVDKLTIGSLSRTVGVAKTSFYWHFKDKQDLLDHMLDYWISEFNTILTDNPELLTRTGEKRLQAIADTIIRDKLPKYELAIRAWACHDKSAQLAFDNMHCRRMAVLKQAFSDAGFEPLEQESRAQVFNCYLNWGNVMHSDTEVYARALKDLIPLLLKH